MAGGTLIIDLDAVAANWRALAASCPGAEPGATVKADAYGLGLGPVARRLAAAGARHFFVALAQEGAELRGILGPGPEIGVFSGHMDGDTGLIRDHALTPMINSPEQMARHTHALPGTPFGLQLDTGMSRLGIAPADWPALRGALPAPPALMMSHLACSDEPDHPMNPAQRAAFLSMTEGLEAPRSLAATGGILLGPAYHFDLCRPGIGLYGGAPFGAARPVVRLSLPVVQTRTLSPGDAVGYGCSWQAARPTRLATVAAGYADGILRSLSNRGRLRAHGRDVPIVGRVSMDLITADVTDLDTVPEALDLLDPVQGVDAVASEAGTIGYEILTALGARYRRHHIGGPAT